MVELRENEKWIPDMEGMYAASKDGYIISYKKSSPKILKPSYTYRHKNKGREYVKLYEIVCLSFNGKNRSYYVHRLIAKTFLGECPVEYTVNHVDGDKYNNHYTNLEYISKSDNSKHSWENGLISSEKLKLSKEEIQKRTNEYYNGVIDENKNIKTYYRKFLDVDFILSKGIPKEFLDWKFSRKRFNNILEYWTSTVKMFRDIENGMSLSALAGTYGLDPSGISRIKSKNYRVKEWESYDRIKKSYSEKINLLNNKLDVDK